MTAPLLRHRVAVYRSASREVCMEFACEDPQTLATNLAAECPPPEFYLVIRPSGPDGPGRPDAQTTAA
jgi:hypothetical protein